MTTGTSTATSEATRQSRTDATRQSCTDGTPTRAPADDEVGGARARIDDLDARIIALVQERRSVSAGIQQARIDSGGRRVHLAREMEILDRYRGELGRPGTQLAMTLLALCRGRL